MAAALSLWGCPKKPEEATQPATRPAAAEAQKGTAQSATSPSTEKAEEPKAERSAEAQEGLRPIYFDFDKSNIRDDVKPVMKANADWLKANPKVRIKIEGNCDERGTIEYNQALGQRRAASAKRYLTDLGVSARRISLISYGKEKPLCTDHTEDCWQKNRRDDFVASNE